MRYLFPQRGLRFVSIGLLVLLLFACAPSQPTPASIPLPTTFITVVATLSPTPTPISPTATAPAATVTRPPAPSATSPATLTRVPPTATLIPGTRTPVPPQVSAKAIPITGVPAPGLASFDQLILDLMDKYQLPGGAVGVVKDGRLVLARGYGYADKDASQPVQPDSLFRIASVSKPFTAAGILTLVQEGKLSLDAPVLPMLEKFQSPLEATPDPGWSKVTIRDLLQHSGGWDRDASFDPMFASTQIATAFGAPGPADSASIIRYMRGQPMQFTAGTAFAYSNFGYNVLGRVIEKTTGQSYADFMRARILVPSGITRMRLGKTRLQERAPGEVRYYDYAGAPLVPSVIPGESMVPAPYGGFYIEAMDSHGGWIASPVDVLRFVNAIEGRNGKIPLLKPASIQSMIARPAVPVWQGQAAYYGLGWYVRPVGADANWWHNGSLSGTTSLLVRAGNGMTWFVVFNSRPRNADGLATALDDGMWQALEQVQVWPDYDLFGDFD